MPKYEERKCMTCGAVFDPMGPNQVCCTAECQKKRKYKLEQERENEKLEGIKRELDKLRKELDHVIGINTTLEERIKEGFKKADIGDASFEECLRCNVKALHLPCGKNKICWDSQPCEKCKHMKMPDFNIALHKGGSGGRLNSEEEFFARYRIVAE